MAKPLSAPLLLALLATSIPALGADVYLLRFDAPSVIERETPASLAKFGHADRLQRYAGHAAAVRSTQQPVLARLEAILGRPLSPKFVYQYGVNGIALALERDEVERVRSTAGVADLAPDEQRRLHTDAGPRWIGAENFWNGAVGAGLGKRGEGVVVGVVDSGISASHPAFADLAIDGFDHANPRGRRFGFCVSGPTPARCNDKLIGIYDFTSEGARDGSDVDGHGTHVASIAAGNPFSGSLSAPTLNVPLTLSGVAPRSNLISYKACNTDSDGGSCPVSAIIAALDQAIADGVDVINYSIGGSPRNPWSGLSGASDLRSMFNARAAGIVVVASAGNEGPAPGTVSTPANAPWVIGVANASHDRMFQTTLTELSGSTSPPQPVFAGLSLSAGMSATAPIVLGEARGSALCSTGSELDFPPSGVSNPFAAGSLNGLILICERGVQARVAKGNNVGLAGGAGMVLINSAAEGESIVADGHFLPTVHLGFAAGQPLKQWLRTTSNARGRITATAAVRDPRFADLLSVSSSRGPDGNSAGVVKPNLTAPGTEIMAADHQSPGIRTLSGTSMASPHVAGAAALLKSTHPDWSAAQIHSALVLTADPSLLQTHLQQAGTIADGGGGRVRVQLASAAGLFLPLDRAGFESGNPNSGADPRTLNLPELYEPGCRSRCVLTRTVEGLVESAWTVSADLPAGLVATVTPASFNLNRGARQTLRFEFEVQSGKLLGQWLNGRIRLNPVGASTQTLSLPLQLMASAGTVVERIQLNVPAERTVVGLDLGGLVALPGAHYAVLGPAPAQVFARSLNADTEDTGDAFEAELGTSTEFFDLVAPDTTIVALARSTTGNNADIDLYVGRDNGDAVASRLETLCAQRSAAAQEQCVLTGLAPGRYWVRLHNPSGGNRGAQLELANLRPGLAHASGPARTQENQTLGLRLALDLGGSVIGARQLGVLQAFGEFDADTPFANIALQLDRTGAADAQPVLLGAGELERFTLAAGGSTDLAFFDLPGDGGQRLLEVSRSGSIQLSLLAANTSLNQTDVGFSPTASMVIGELAAATTATTLNLSATSAPRRLFVRASNSGTQSAQLGLRLAAATAMPLASGTRPGMYFNPARAGHGVFLSRARNELQLAWYTYDAQSQPTFYLGFADAAFTEGQTGMRSQVELQLQRFAWNGRVAKGQSVGRAVLTSLGPDRFQYSWTLDQASGSEAMELLASNACVSQSGRSLDFTGLWFNPELPGYGVSIFTRPDLEIQAVYLYDQQGQPRWLWNDSSPFGLGATPLFQYRGFCPGCSLVPVSRTAVGTLTRNYAATPGTAGSWRVQAQFINGLAGSSWDTTGPLLALTETAVCQ